MTSSYPALVLNADFAPLSTFPLSVWDFMRTLRHTLADRVTVLEYHDAVLHSAHMEYRPPSVVALKRYIKRPDTVPFTRMNLFLRDNFTCQYCGEKHAPKDLTFDHVVPRAAGGETNWENIVAACVPCNTRKGHRRDVHPRCVPRQPTPYELRRARPPELGNLHESWMDYLYWSGVLEKD